MRRVQALGCFFAWIGMVSSQFTWSASSTDIEAARVKGLAFLYKSQKGDGGWFTHESLKTQTTATVLEALINSGIKSGETYGAASAWLSNAETPSIDASARKIAALASTGMNPLRIAPLLASLFCTAVTAAVKAEAQDYPTKPVRLLVVGQCDICAD